MIRLKSLSIKAFRSFAEESTFEFPTRGLVLVRGNNTKTGESSGTGKSTINLAVAYALDFPNQLPATELQSWLTKEPLQVTLGLETPKGEVVISRGKKNSIKVGDEITTGARAISEKMREVLGQPPEVMSALTYRPQGKEGLFLGKTDSEKKEFLSQLLGLEKFEESVTEIEGKLKLIALTLPQLEGNIITNMTFLNSAKQRFDEVGLDDSADGVKVLLEKAKEDLQVAKQAAEQARWELNHSKKLEDIRDQIDGTHAELSRLEVARREKEAEKLKPEAISEMVAVKENIVKRIKDLETDDAVRKKKLDDHIGTLRNKLAEARSRIATAPFLHKAVSEISTKIASIKAAKCPTCGQKWPDHLSEDLSRHLEELATKKIQLDNIQLGDEPFAVSLAAEIGNAQAFQPDENIQKLAVLEKRFIADISSQESKFQATKNEELKAVTDKILVQQRKLNMLGNDRHAILNDLQGKVDKCREKAVEIDNFTGTCQIKIAAVGRSNEVKQKARVSCEQEVKKCEERYDASVAELQKAETLQAQEKDYVAMVGRGGFLGLIFDEILQEVSDEANAQLGKLANVSHVTIRFRTETLQQKGTIKKAIVPLVSVDGHEGRLESALSGGMKDSVHQVVDLALMSVIQRRTGVMPGWFIMDEAGSGQGLITKESALEILRNYAQDKLILVVDHSTEIKEAFSQFIDVEYTNGFSRACQS